MKALAGVIGWPVAHSLSPALHTAWIEAAGLDASYVHLPVKPGDEAAAFRGLAALGLKGANVTLPHKEAALTLADHATALARRCGAANLLTVAGGALTADNTDVKGFLAGLPTEGLSQDRPAVVMGAGGAARGVVVALVIAGWRAITVVNRSIEKAQALIAAVAAPDMSCVIRSSPWEERAAALEDAGVLVNATSLGMTGKPELDLDLELLPNDALVYDVIYTPIRTELLKRAEARGNACVDGLDMLIGQARPSFEMLFGHPAPISVDARAVLLERL